MTSATAPAQAIAQAASYQLADDQVARYRSDGFLHTPGVLTTAEAESLRGRFLATSERGANLKDGYGSNVFDQYVNLWRQDRSLLDLALHPNMRAIATRLAGAPLRLWHDHLLVKRAKNGVPTEWHQDQPYWPHSDSAASLSAWVALVDAPQVRGCMSYIPGSHRHTELDAQNLQDATDLFRRCPELQWVPAVTVPVKAGDVVWHHARTAHRAESNRTDQDRVVVSVIYMPRSTRFTGGRHICTDGRGINAGDLLAGNEFPEV